MAEKYPKQMSFSCSKCAIFTLTICNDCDAFYCKNCFNQAHSSIGIDAAHRLSELNRKTMMKGTEMKFCKAHERDVNAGISSDSSFLRDPSCLWCQCIENDDTENSCDNHQYDKTVSFFFLATRKNLFYFISEKNNRKIFVVFLDYRKQ